MLDTATTATSSCSSVVTLLPTYRGLGDSKTADTMDGNARGSKRQRVLQTGAGVSYGGGKVAKERRPELPRVRVDPQVKDIPPETFKGCVNLTAVQFEEGSLRSIGDSAFNGCKALEQVTIPSSVTTLGSGAFIYCTNLSHVQVQEGLGIIGDYAFSGCKALEQVTIPSSVTTLGNNAFNGCTNLANVQLNDGLQDIGNHAFNGCTALRSVTVPSSATKLENGTLSRASKSWALRLTQILCARCGPQLS